MSLFSKYRPAGYIYKEPERISQREARERRLLALLEREPRFGQVRNFQQKVQEIQASRSRVLTEINSNDAITKRQKAASIAAALSTFQETDFSDPGQAKTYRDLRRAQIALEAAKQSGGGQRKVNPTGLDLRSFNPAGKEHASTITGTAARLASRIANGFLPSFKMPTHVLPCVQRHAQREVMFAKGHAGRGYKTKKRRTWASAIPC